MSIIARQFLIAFLCCAFALQTWLVYSDTTGRAEPLSAKAETGRALWHEQGCQTCHQLHGFGGFLGPDLTNAAQHLTKARLDSILTIGAGQMPGFELEPDERSAITAFLTEMDRTGVGQLPPLISVSAPEVLDEAVLAAVKATTALTEAEARGRVIVAEQKCLACHLPNPTSLKRAPDLTGLVERLRPSGVRGIVTSGIPAKGMPPFDLPEADLEALVQFLTWMSTQADSIHAAFSAAMPEGGASSLDLPWFEYR